VLRYDHKLLALGEAISVSMAGDAHSPAPAPIRRDQWHDPRPADWLVTPCLWLWGGVGAVVGAIVYGMSIGRELALLGIIAGAITGCTLGSLLGALVQTLLDLALDAGRPAD
jgi:hypothetical protein